MKTKDEIKSLFDAVEMGLKIASEYPEVGDTFDFDHWNTVYGVLGWALGKAGKDFDNQTTRLLAMADQVAAMDKLTK